MSKNVRSFLAIFLLNLINVKVLGFFFSVHPSDNFVSHSRCIASSIYSKKKFPSIVLDANLVTFDLDDTIFPVGPIMDDANKALIHHLNKSLGCSTTEDDLMQTTKLIRTELSKVDKVIRYTELRKRAIRIEIMKYRKQSTVDVNVDDDIVSNCYDIWEEQRQSAGDVHLYPDTISMLKEIKENYPDVVIAAITNGKANPLKMVKIRKYFDYCVSGEDDDVFPLRKPHEKIYNVAIERYKELLCETRGIILKNMDEQCWIHVGDDLANDVGASAKCGAHAIWTDLEEEYNQTASKRDANAAQQQAVWSTASKAELENRRMMNEKAKKFITKKVTTLSEVPKAIRMITTSMLSSS